MPRDLWVPCLTLGELPGSFKGMNDILNNTIYSTTDEELMYSAVPSKAPPPVYIIDKIAEDLIISQPFQR